MLVDNDDLPTRVASHPTADVPANRNGNLGQYRVERLASELLGDEYDYDHQRPSLRHVDEGRRLRATSSGSLTSWVSGSSMRLAARGPAIPLDRRASRGKGLAMRDDLPPSTLRP